MIDVRNAGHKWGYRWRSTQKGWRKKSYAEYLHFTWQRWGYDRKELTLTELRAEYDKAFDERLKVNLKEHRRPDPWEFNRESGRYYLAD